MTVSTTTNRYSYAGNGVTTAFAYSSKFLADSDLVVLTIVDSTGVSTTKTLNTDYTVTGATTDSGTVTFVTAPATGTTVLIYGEPALTQPIDLVEGDPLPVETAVERGFDRATLQIQRNRELIERSVRLADSDTSGASPVLPAPEADALVGWDGTGMLLENKVAADLSLHPVSTYIATLLDDPDAATARTTLGAVGLTGNETVAGDKALTGATTMSGAVTMSNTTQRTGSSIDGPVNYAAATGTDTYLCTLSPAPAALINNMILSVYFANANISTTPTLNPNSLGAKTIKRINGSAMFASDLSGRHLLLYNGTDFICLNPRHVLRDEELGSPTMTTQAALDNSTKGATTAYVDRLQGTKIQGTYLFGLNNGAQGNTTYLGEFGVIAGSNTQSATETDMIWWPTRPVMLRDLYINLGSAVGGSGQTCTVTIRKNGANPASGPSVTINSGSSTGEDTVNTVTAGPGDYLSIRCVLSATTGSLTVMGSIRFVDPASGYGISLIPFNTTSSNVAGRAIVGIASPSQLLDTAQMYPVAHSNCYLSEYYEQAVTGATVATTMSIAATSATITATAKLYTPWIYGSTATDVSAYLRGLMLTQGSWYQMQIQTDGATVRRRGCWVLKQRASTGENEIKPLYFSADAAAQASTVYMRGHSSSASATEANAQFRLTAGTLKNFILLNEGTGVAGQTWTANVRINGVQQFTIALSGTTTVNSDTSSTVTVAAGDKLSIELVSSATTGTKKIQFACDHFA